MGAENTVGFPRDAGGTSDCAAVWLAVVRLSAGVGKDLAALAIADARPVDQGCARWIDHNPGQSSSKKNQPDTLRAPAAIPISGRNLFQKLSEYSADVVEHASVTILIQEGGEQVHCATRL